MEVTPLLALSLQQVVVEAQTCLIRQVDLLEHPVVLVVEVKQILLLELLLLLVEQEILHQHRPPKETTVALVELVGLTMGLAAAVAQALLGAMVLQLPEETAALVRLQAFPEVQ
jgi:hypothetical protein